ncbi:MAG: serine/threonine protein kinase [Anaerolineales bacterium]|nr:serine/threonine protein kinase [Anaerolineales bacterium]
MADELLAQRYRVIRELGAGGMGRILLAEDTSLSIQSEPHLVAVKENTNVSHDAQEQFRREARILARLAHPNLPKVTHHFVEPTGKQYLVMDYIRGDDVQQLLRKGPLTEQESLACMAQILDALSYLHNWQDPDTGRRQPVIHRDIKPSNIKRTQQGQYMLVDFGIAKLSGLTETQPSARAYTSGYAPLEQYDGGTDERSDIYSLGATLYSMLTARTPPTATNRVSGVAVPQPRHYNASLSNHVGRVIDRAMQVKPKDRFQSAAAMYLELFGRSLPDRSVRSDADLSPVPSGPVWQRPVAAILLAVAGFVLVALALILFLQRKDSQVNAPLPTATAQLVQPATTAATTTLASAIVVAKETLVATRLPAVAPSASNVIAVVETPVATGRNNTSPPPAAPAATSTPLPATVYPQQATVSTAYLDMLRDNAQRLVVRPDQPPIQKQGLIRGAQAACMCLVAAEHLISVWWCSHTGLAVIRCGS